MLSSHNTLWEQLRIKMSNYIVYYHRCGFSRLVAITCPSKEILVNTYILDSISEKHRSDIAGQGASRRELKEYKKPKLTRSSSIVDLLHNCNIYIYKGLL